MRRLLTLLLLCATPAMAEPPRIVADIAPVQSLVATVMAGAGTPELLIPAGVSPHDLSLKPSQARALGHADLVVWMGPEMSPWLGRVLEANGAAQMPLIRVPGTTVLAFRENALFGDDHDSHTEGGHTEDGHDHGHGGIDPHAWLDPDNAVVWMQALAERLAQMDPEHADLYRANATAGVADLRALTRKMTDQLAPARSIGLIAFHDAFQYLEARFGLHMVGSVTPGDDSDPGPARISALRAAAQAGEVVCAFAEPQFNPGLLEAVTEDAGLPVAVLDPLGATIEPGAELYAAMMSGMADTIATCVAQAGKGE
ncbi:MAG: zinc transporter [Rhodobacteraceae bacterium]|nr:zinc transporter [Paracoccaceae bacterium]MAY48262.1 zinc transporter [Paracoccaceae bacterium]